jgi:ABC-type iron transport system FetAB permease component
MVGYKMSYNAKNRYFCKLLFIFYFVKFKWKFNIEKLILTNSCSNWTKLYCLKTTLNYVLELKMALLILPCVGIVWWQKQMCHLWGGLEFF